MTEKLEQTGRVTLVTGASRGIGCAAALEIAKRGGHVIALARTQGGLEELDDAISKTPGSATLVPMDLRQPDSLFDLAKVVHERWGRLDGVIAAAGLLGVLSPLSQINPKTWGEAFTVNFQANFVLLRAFEPLLVESEAGRAVFLTSGASKNLRAYWSVYASSKAALDAMVTCWAKEMAPTNIKANLMNPGPVHTAMREQAMPGEDPNTLNKPERVAKLIADMAAPDWTRAAEWVAFNDLEDRYPA